MNVELDLSNYAKANLNKTKANLKNVNGVYTSNFAKKTDSAKLKSDVDKLN